MTGKTGEILGADLGKLWHAGKHDLPLVADDYRSAWFKTPSSVSSLCSRGGGLGSNPGAHLDSVIDRVNKFLKDTETALNEVGEALVWVADEYAATDASCQSAFNAKKKAMEAGD